jgi:phospholipid/cholesterol/gamma-HCH transport system substrate-binding protein
MTQRMRIGVFLGGALLLMAVLVFIVGDLGRLFRPAGYSISTSFSTVAGLDKNAVVRLSGVKIGYVRDIRLEGRLPRVEMILDPWAKVPVGSKATLSSLGLLGEKYVEILPGPETSLVAAGGSIESLASVSFDQLGTLIMSIGDEVKGVSGRVQRFLGDDNEARLRETLDNLSRASQGLNDFLRANRGGLDDSVRAAAKAFRDFDRDVKSVADSLNAAAQSVTALVDGNRQSVQDDLERMKSILEQMDDAVKRLNGILQKTEKGEGSLGKLLTQPELYDRAKEAVDDLRSAVRPLAALRLGADVRAEYYPRSELWKGTLTFNAGLASGPMVRAQIVRDPWQERFTYSLQGGRRWGAFAPRLGIIESDFGLGLDFYAWRDRLQLSLDGYGLNRDAGPRLRLSSRFFPDRHFFLTLGLDDLIYEKQRELYFGLGVAIQ